MNKNAYRIVFNAHRGVLMVVAENAAGDAVGNAGGGRGTVDAPGVTDVGPMRKSRSLRMAQLAVFVGAMFGTVTVVSAQIVAAPNAASRPVVAQSANGLPVVQIVTPNGAGVSHNRYDQFNVGTGGAILNNSSTTVQTQQAGFIAGNAALVAGSARLILNEVTSSSRSQLNGFIEVAGQRAEVIVANPNGISCSNCGFINTSRGTLATGTPELAADGSLANLRVTCGDVTIGSGGMNASGLDQVDLIARSVQVNGELWGKQLNVISGANLVNYANLGVQVIAGQGTQPTVGIDLAQMGGMYANRIRLVGTEGGVGVRSMGNIAALAGDISIDSKGVVSLNGTTSAAGNVAITSQSAIDNSGKLYAKGNLVLRASAALTNTDGIIHSDGNLTLTAQSIDTNGLISSRAKTVVRAATNLRNTGRIYGEDIALGAQTFHNSVNAMTGVAGVVAARNSIQIGAHQVANSEHASLQSLGDMTIAGWLDSSIQAVGNATSIINESATINAGKTLRFKTALLINRNKHFVTSVQEDPTSTRHVTQYAYWAAPDTWYDASQVRWSDSGGGGIVLVIPDGNRFEQFYKRDYTEVIRRTVVLSSDPGQISSGGDMLLSGNVTNDKSVMIAGGTLSGSVGEIDNIGAKGTQTTIWHMTAGENYYHWVSGHPHRNYYRYNNGGAAYDNVMASTTVDLPVGRIEQNTTPKGFANSAMDTGAASPFLIPNHGLYAVPAEPGRSYLVETDPRFTDYKTFITSDYMLGKMALDPQTVQKRLGDGFYEQKLIADQVSQLSGKRMLGGYTSAEDQYKALMDAGVASASRFELTPGIALTDAQIAALTSDIVWLVEQEVKLPDGTTTKALAPVVYLSRASAEDIKPAGTLMAGKNIDLKVNGTLDNGGILLASDNVVVQAADINNTGSVASTSAAGSVALTAVNDVQSSGNISGNRVGILAGRDVNLASTTASAMTHDGLNTKLDQVSSVNAGSLVIQAERDVNLVGASIQSTDDAKVLAKRNIHLGYVEQKESYDVKFDIHNYLNQRSTQVFGTAIKSKGGLALWATQDITSQAGYAHADGALTVAAKRDVNIGVAYQGHHVDQAIFTTSQGWLSSSSFRVQRKDSSATSAGSTWFGNAVDVQAGNELNVTGSGLVGIADVSLHAANNVNIGSAQNTRNSRFEVQSKKSGFFANGLSLSLGSSSRSELQVNNSMTNDAGVVGSTGGNVTITAGKDAVISGSHVIAGEAASGAGGGISITAQNVTVDASQNITEIAQSYDLRHRSIGFALAGTSYDTMKNLLSINNGRGNDGQKTKAAGEEIGASGLSIPQLRLGIGRRTSQGFTKLNHVANQGSVLTAAGDIRLTATGSGSADALGRAIDGSISIRGSQLTAGGAAVLNAADDINIVTTTEGITQESGTSSPSNFINFSVADLGTLARSLSGGPNQGGTSLSPIAVASENGNGSVTATIQDSSGIRADSIKIVSRTGDIKVAGSKIIGDEEVSLLAQRGRIRIDAGQNEKIERQANDSNALGNLGSSKNGTATTVGYRSTSDNVDSSQQLQSPVRSRIVSKNGNVSLDAKQDLSIQGADLSANIDLTLIGQNVSLDAGTDASQHIETHRSRQVGVTTSIGGVAGQITQVSNAALEARANGDDRLAQLYAAQAAVIGATAAKGMTTDGASSPQLVKVTVALGVGNSESQSSSLTMQQQGSTLLAGNAVSVVATGNGQADAQGLAVDGDINMTGTQVSGKNVDLVAARDINAVSAIDTTNNRSGSNSGGASIGVGLALGGDQNGFTLELGATKEKAFANGESLVNHNTHITASETLSLSTGRDANLLGAQLRGESVEASIGRHLSIVSQQDRETYHAQQIGEGIGLSLCIPPFCYGNAVSASGSAESGNVDITYKSVNEQSGIYAGSGGYHIHVNENTDLKGAAIASSAMADKNTLSTGTLTTSDIENKTEYSSSNGGVVLGFATGKVGVAQNVLSNIVSNLAANSQNPKPGSAQSVTKSAISDGTVVIKDAQGQQEKTGQNAEQTIASLNRDTTHAGAPIDKTFDLKKIQRDQEVARATGQLAQQIAPLLYEKVGAWLHAGKADTAEKVLVHALVGGLMTKAMGGDFGTGAVGAATAKLAVEAFGKDIAGIDGLSKQDQDALIQLVALSVAKVSAQVAGATPTEGNAAGLNAKLATEFNYLKHQQVEDFRSEYAQCETVQCKTDILTDMRRLSDAQDALLSQCTTTEACKALTADVAYPTRQNGWLGFFVTDTADVYNFCPPGDSACNDTLKYVSARTNQAAMTNIAPAFYAAINWQNATVATTEDELQEKFGLSPQAASVLAIAMVQSVHVGTKRSDEDSRKFNSKIYKGEMLGVNGIQTPSTTVWRGSGKERIDIENPAPGVRAGQIHYQDNAGNKYYYDPNLNVFFNPKSQGYAPKSVQNMLLQPEFSKAIDRALYGYLGVKK